MKNLFLLLTMTSLVIVQRIYSQGVTTVPVFPNGDSEITLIFDLKQAKDNRAQGLLGKTSDVFLWAGCGSTDAGNAFEYQPVGQTDFSKVFEPGRMTSLGNDRWSIKMTARKYFNVPADKAIKKLGVLLKSADGRAQTEDFIVKIYDNAQLQLAFFKPTSKSFFVDANQTIDIVAVVSQKANLSLRLGNQVLRTANADSIHYQLKAGNAQNVRQKVTLTAQVNNQTAIDSFFFAVSPNPEIAPLPTGLKDGVNYLSDSRVIVSLYAPLKKFAYLIGEFNNWQALPNYLMKRTADGSRYWIEINNLEPNREYAYQFLVDGELAVADPYCDKILDPNFDNSIPAANYPNLKPYPSGAKGIVSVLQTAQKPYLWQTNNFVRPDATKLNVYELLVRDFSATRRYQTIADSLPYLKKLGINTIELMPVMEFTANESWGYNPIFYMAPDKAYGTKNDLKSLIDKCHANGIAVVLDMVLNQADYEFPYVKMYWDGAQPTKDSPFFNQTATHPYSVFFDFNHESPATQAYVKRVCEYWIKEYRFDGYRFDLSKGFTQTNTGNSVNAWGLYDASRVAIWKRIYDEIRAYDKTAYIILEHFADNPEEMELSDYGMLFWGNHNDDYRKAAAGMTRNMEGISYKKRGWTKPHLIGYMESHDEERQVYDLLQTGRQSDEQNTRDLKVALERAKLATAFFLGVPGPKMIWQFGELGYDISINQNGRTGNKPILWNYLQNNDRAKLMKVYQELFKLRNTQAAFHTNDFTLNFDRNIKRITLNHSSMKVFMIGNFDVISNIEEANFPSEGKWYDYFTGQELNVAKANEMVNLKAGEFHIFTTIKLATPEAGLMPWGGAFSPILSVHNAVKDFFEVSPNPAQNHLQGHLDYDYSGPMALQLIDISGRVVRQKSVQKTTQIWHDHWDLDNIAAGVYFYQISTNNQRFTKKIMVVE